MFGKIQNNVQNEETPFYPRSPYAVSKLYAHWMTINYRESYDIFGSCGILFNHESPLRGEEFVTKKITTAVARIKNSMQDTLFLGNLNAKRDWGFAKDYVIGMWKMLQIEKPDTFILATGKNETIRNFARMAFSAAGMEIEFVGSYENETGIDKKTGKTLLKVDKSLYRPSEVEVLLGNPKKAKKELGWEATTNLEELAKIMVNYDLKNLKS
jgi:GDPmannose 4,6-dehydratase